MQQGVEGARARGLDLPANEVALPGPPAHTHLTVVDGNFTTLNAVKFGLGCQQTE